MFKSGLRGQSGRRRKRDSFAAPPRDRARRVGRPTDRSVYGQVRPMVANLWGGRGARGGVGLGFGCHTQRNGLNADVLPLQLVRI